jgi:hypothetical protein
MYIYCLVQKKCQLIQIRTLNALYLSLSTLEYQPQAIPTDNILKLIADDPYLTVFNKFLVSRAFTVNWW